MIASFNFHAEFKDKYIRNNRNSGQKSIRCFPCCGPNNCHVNGGFCGEAVSLTISLFSEDNEKQFNPSQYIFIAEMRKSESLDSLSMRKYIEKNELDTQMRTKSNRGYIMSADVKEMFFDGNIFEAEITFNVTHCSWDYAWISSRWHGPNTQHVFDVIVLKSINSSRYKVCSSCCSTPFLLESSKRAKKRALIEGPATLPLPIPKKKLIVGKDDRDAANMMLSLINGPAFSYDSGRHTDTQIESAEQEMLMEKVKKDISAAVQRESLLQQDSDSEEERVILQ